VRVRFLAGNNSGTATITAISGGVASSTQSPLRILVGTAAVGSVRVTANPTLLPAIGGTSVITAQALDINGNPLSSAPVTFSTTAGIIDQAFATTDQNGLSTTTLRTSTTATVTAAVGAQAGSSTPTPPPASGTTPPATTPSASGVASGSVQVNVSGAPSLLITPPATPPGEGLPATFTIAVTAAAANGSAVRDVTVDWGDGTTQSLGVVTGNATVSHIYRTAGPYRIVVTATDSFGNVVNQSTSVTVIPVALPTVNITPNVPPTPSNPTNVTFTLQVTPPTGVNIKNATIDYGDGIKETLGGVNGTITKQHQYSHNPGQSFTITMTVEDTLGRLTTGTTTIIIP
jgi:adhesin/invasin